MTATSAHLVLENFAYRTKLITPTIAGERYKELGVDLPEIEPGEQPGTTRMFTIDWDEAAPVEGKWSGYDRIAWHTVIQVVYYPAASLGDRAARYELILSDRHDIISALEAQSSRDGYDADHASTDVGLQVRQCGVTSLDRDEDVWQLVLPFQCLIKEIV